LYSTTTGTLLPFHLPRKKYFDAQNKFETIYLSNVINKDAHYFNDDRRIWTRMQMIKSDSSTTAAAGAVDLQDSDEESMKWNWYIS